MSSARASGPSKRTIPLIPRDVSAVQVEPDLVDRVGLDAALHTVERRVCAHAHRGGVDDRVLGVGSHDQTRGVHAIGRHGSMRRRREVGGGVAELASAVVAVDDCPLDAVGTAE